MPTIGEHQIFSAIARPKIIRKRSSPPVNPSQAWGVPLKTSPTQPSHNPKTKKTSKSLSAQPQMIIKEVPVDRFVIKEVPRELTEVEKKEIFLEYMIKLRNEANEKKKQKLVSKREQVLSFIYINGTVTMRELRDQFRDIPKTSMQRIVDELALFGKIEKDIKNKISIFKVIK